VKKGVHGPTKERLRLAREVKQLRAQGLTQKDVGTRLGISRSYSSELERDPKGATSRARKDSYARPCVDCGRPVSGADGPNNLPKRCESCRDTYLHEHKRWTRGAIIDAIQRFAAVRGRAPTVAEWQRANPRKGYPAAWSVYSLEFKSWADAIEAAGFPRPTRGRRSRNEVA
jgi:transcriptional regulator with XRE-family HTH domain